MAKILIVDDSRTSRKILRGLLEEAGHEIVAEAQDGRDGVDKYKEFNPDITTLDITMPVMDGLEALTKIKEWTCFCSLLKRKTKDLMNLSSML